MTQKLQKLKENMLVRLDFDSKLAKENVKKEILMQKFLSLKII